MKATLEISPADLIDLLKQIGQLGILGNADILNKIMTALETLTQSVTNLGASVTDLTASVDNAVTHINTPGGATDTQLASLASVVDGLTTTLAAQKARLDAAVANPPADVTPTATA